MEHTEYYLRAHGIHMWFCQIQSKDVVKGFYLQNFSPDAELKFWSEFFQIRSQELAREEGFAVGTAQTSLKIALKCHPLSDGYRHRPTSASSWTSKRNLAVHVEFKGAMLEIAS
eukprot:7154294-Ditylum_brightwellii.AAC.1